MTTRFSALLDGTLILPGPEQLKRLNIGQDHRRVAARLAPQARPTITEARPREAMPVANPELEAQWRAAHIND